MTQTEPFPEGDAQVTALLKENAFLKAGVDLSSPQGEILLSSWGDKALDVTAIADAGKLIGAVPTPEPAPAASTETPPAAEPATATSTEVREPGEATQVIERQLLSGEGYVPPPATTGREAALEAAKAAGLKGATTKQQIAVGFHELATAAGAGDKTVLVGGREA